MVGVRLFLGMRKSKAQIFFGVPLSPIRNGIHKYPRQMIHRKQVGGISCLAEEWLGRGL